MKVSITISKDDVSESESFHRYCAMRPALARLTTDKVVSVCCRHYGDALCADGAGNEVLLTVPHADAEGTVEVEIPDIAKDLFQPETWQERTN